VKIVLSDHAKKQRIERKIPLKDILQTIKNPQTKKKSYRDRRLLQKEFNGKILEVVIFNEEEVIAVITEYYLEEE